MTAQADVRVPSQEEGIEFGLVRAVAGCAFADNHGGVSALDILDFLARVGAMA
jgi:hypothetical protein